MLNLLSTLFFLLLGATATFVEFSDYYNDGSYAWLGQVTATQDSSSRDRMRNEVKQAYEEMVHDAKDRGIVAPSTMALIVVPSKGHLFHSSIKNRHPTGRELLNTCTDHNHRYNGNCAEMAAIDQVRESVHWSLKGAYIAVYGIEDLVTGHVNWLHPCGDKDGKTGCDTILQADDLICITKRGLEVLDPDTVSISAISSRSLLTTKPTTKPPAKGGSKSGSKSGTPKHHSSGGAACRASKVKRFVAEPAGLADFLRRSLRLDTMFGEDL